MKIKLFLSILLTTALLTACQKDFTVDNPLQQSTTTTDSTLLKMYIELDTIGGIDTLIKSTYEYDSQNRLSTIKTKIYRDSFFLNRYYSYNSNDTLVSSILQLYYGKDQGNFYYDSVFFYFNRNTSNQITKDSALGYFKTNQGQLTSSKTVSDFTYFGDSIHRVIKFYNPTPTILDEFSYKQIKVNGNIMQEREDPDPAGQNRFAILTYDNKKNPFSAEKIFYPVHFSPNNFDFTDMPLNNVLTETENSGVSNSTYTYNNLGLPKTVIITNSSNPLLGAFKGIYIFGN